MDEREDDNNSPIFCAKCSTELKPGTGDFFIVRIETMADPSPPRLSEEDINRDHRSEIQRLIKQMNGMSEREISEQVHRRMVLHLCGQCYRRWIEDPVG
jgi:hypothetical protein